MGELLLIDDKLKARHLWGIRVGNDSMGYQKNPNNDPENRSCSVEPINEGYTPHKGLKLTNKSEGICTIVTF